jgi:hypothetical protein
LTDGNQGERGGARRVSFDEALAEALARRSVDAENFCPQGDLVTRRVLEEYGAMFVAAESVLLPSVCMFKSEEEVLAFQREAGWRAATFGADTIELQPAALAGLLAARAEAQSLGLDITPRGGAEAGRRGFDDALRLWRSRCDPALEHWSREGRLSPTQAERVRCCPLPEQMTAVLELEKDGLFFSKDFAKSILRSVAAPGASQHLAMLAFDAVEFRDARVRQTLARHGWHQTVLSDLPHFTYLGLAASELPARGLKLVEECGQEFWVPDMAAAKAED